MLAVSLLTVAAAAAGPAAAVADAELARLAWLEGR